MPCMFSVEINAHGSRQHIVHIGMSWKMKMMGHMYK